MTVAEASLGSLVESVKALQKRLFGQMEVNVPYKDGEANSNNNKVMSNSTFFGFCPSGCLGRGDCFNGTCICQVMLIKILDNKTPQEIEILIVKSMFCHCY